MQGLMGCWLYSKMKAGKAFMFLDIISIPVATPVSVHVISSIIILYMSQGSFISEEYFPTVWNLILEEAGGAVSLHLNKVYCPHRNSEIRWINYRPNQGHGYN